MKTKLLAVILLLLSVNAFAWNKLPGTAHDVGDGWIIGTSAVGSTGDYNIWRWDDNKWTAMPGAAVRIGGTYNSPWVVNNAGAVFRWNGAAWAARPGIQARDVGDGFAISTTATAGGYEIYRYDTTGWTKLPGGAVRVGGTYKFPWIVSNLGEIFRWNGSSWNLLPGKGVDIADGWVLGTTLIGTDYSIHRWNGSGWTQVSGAARNVGSAGGSPWIVNSSNEIFRW